MKMLVQRGLETCPGCIAVPHILTCPIILQESCFIHWRIPLPWFLWGVTVIHVGNFLTGSCLTAPSIPHTMDATHPSVLREDKDPRSDLAFATVARVADGTPRPVTLILVPQPFEPQGNRLL